MAYHTIGKVARRGYAITNGSSSIAAVHVFATRGTLDTVFQAPRVSQTAAAGSWTASKNGSQITGLSSVAVTTSAVGESSGVTSASPTAATYVAKGDVFSVVGSSLSASTWTLVVREY